jgi:chorismate mutase-like protein
MPASDDCESDLDRHRAAIDALDREILERLNARATHAQAIGALKGAAAAYRPEREAQVLSRLQSANPGPLPNEAVARHLPPGDVGIAALGGHWRRLGRRAFAHRRSPSISASRRHAALRDNKRSVRARK